MKLGRKKKIIVTVHPGGDTVVAAYCLSTDLWEDHEWFLNEALRQKDLGDVRAMNRNLRASLIFLFSHLDAVATQICFAIKIPPGRFLRDRIKALNLKAMEIGSINTLDLDSEFDLRNLIAHVTERNESVQENLYQNLTFDSIKLSSKKISNWLDALCNALEVERFSDTKSMAELFLGIFGGGVETHEV